MLLKDSDVAERLAVSRRQVWKLRASGRLPEPIRMGGNVRWRESDIDQWVAEGCPANWTPTPGKAVCA